MIVKLPFADDSVAVDLRGLRVRPLEPRAPRGTEDPGRLLSRAVDFPVAGPSLSDLAGRSKSAVVVVPDATRDVALPTVLPVVLNRLIAGGIDSKALEVLVACGTHPPGSTDTIRQLVGPLPTGVQLHQHRADEPSELAVVGELRPGIALRLNKRVLESDLVVTVGGVKHHYFAGFGGGPKMIFPGIAGIDEIQANHSLVLRACAEGLERHPACEPGVLKGNPVAEEIARAADVGPEVFAVCLVPGRDGGNAWATAGPWRLAFAAAVERVREWYELTDGTFDRLVASGGGRPFDASLIQAHKGFDAICRFAAPGAEVIYVADLGDGPGSPAMEPFLADPRPAAILDRLARSYVQYGHTTLRILEKTARLRVFLKSSLDPDIARTLGFVPVDDLDEITERWRQQGSRDHVGVMARTAVWPAR